MTTSLVKSAKVWMTLYVDLLCTVYVGAVTASSLIFQQDPALAGMIMSLAISLIGDTSYGVDKASEVENQMTSVERVVTYTKLPSEPGYNRTQLPREGWPEQGAVTFRDVSLVYREGSTRVLQNINVDIAAKERVGIAGRTGAGKSSLVAALFRLPEPQGQVLIDGVDLGTIDIQSARRAIAVISQNPVLFGGSLRKNLDPIHKFSDQEIWTALEEVQLFDTIQKLPGQLEYQLRESGTSFSVGERQLLCLARALLQKSKVLVLDEATANVDYKTDMLIQQVLRNKFNDCTLLTIAHRLNTIMDYDKVLVMDQGHVVEYDRPEVLAWKKNGVFARLIKNSELNLRNEFNTAHVK